MGKKRITKKQIVKKVPAPKSNPDTTPPASPAGTEAEIGMRLNKYVAHCGLCSRRKAAEYVKEGLIKVNGVVEKAPGYLVQDTDEVSFKEKNYTRK